MTARKTTSESMMAWMNQQVDTANDVANSEGKNLQAVAFVLCYENDIVVGFRGEDKSLVLRGISELTEHIKRKRRGMRVNARRIDG